MRPKLGKIALTGFRGSEALLGRPVAYQGVPGVESHQLIELNSFGFMVHAPNCHPGDTNSRKRVTSANWGGHKDLRKMEVRYIVG